MTAKEAWGRLSIDHAPVLQRARDCAALTIPALLPPGGSNDATSLPQPYQSVGARGLNNLAAKLLLALFPPGSPFFRLLMTVDLEEEAEPDVRNELEKRLQRIEARAMRAFEASVIRPRLAEALTHLVATGNVLIFYNKLDDFRIYRIDQYAIRRDASGNPVEAVVKESVHPATLSEEVRAACELDKPKGTQREVDIYTHVEWVDGRVKYRQEINDKVVPGTEGDVPLRDSPWIALRWKAAPGQDYGRGHVEEHFGDLRSLEGLSQSIVEFAAAASKIVWLVHPNSSTDIEDVNNAESGEAVTGNKADIDALQLEKYADFQVAQAVASRLEERLSHAFLLRSGVTRDAERVTAEEIRAVAQELEDALGGVYTVLAQELQLPFVRRHLAVLTRAARIPRLPKDTVDPVIVTGFQALGRNHSLNRLRGFISDMVNTVGPEFTMSVLRPEVVAARLGMGWGVEDLDGLIKSSEELAAERVAQQLAAMQQTLVEKATGPVATEMARQAAEQ